MADFSKTAPTLGSPAPKVSMDFQWDEMSPGVACNALFFREKMVARAMSAKFGWI